MYCIIYEIINAIALHNIKIAIARNIRVKYLRTKYRLRLVCVWWWAGSVPINASFLLMRFVL